MTARLEADRARWRRCKIAEREGKAARGECKSCVARVARVGWCPSHQWRDVAPREDGEDAPRCSALVAEDGGLLECGEVLTRVLPRKFCPGHLKSDRERVARRRNAK